MCLISTLHILHILNEILMMKTKQFMQIKQTRPRNFPIPDLPRITAYRRKAK